MTRAPTRRENEKPRASHPPLSSFGGAKRRPEDQRRQALLTGFAALGPPVEACGLAEG
jgi:hypothetical protein